MKGLLLCPRLSSLERVQCVGPKSLDVTLEPECVGRSPSGRTKDKETGVES